MKFCYTNVNDLRVFENFQKILNACVDTVGGQLSDDVIFHL